MLLGGCCCRAGASAPVAVSGLLFPRLLGVPRDRRGGVWPVAATRREDAQWSLLLWLPLGSTGAAAAGRQGEARTARGSSTRGSAGARAAPLQRWTWGWGWEGEQSPEGGCRGGAGSAQTDPRTDNTHGPQPAPAKMASERKRK